MSPVKMKETPTTAVCSGGEEYKLHVSRVPTKFDADVVKRILQERLGNDKAVVQVELVYPRPEPLEHSNGKKQPNENQEEEKKEEEQQPLLEHRGFGFVHLQTAELLEQALALQTIKGGFKATSKRQHIMHLRSYVKQDKGQRGHGEGDEDEDDDDVKRRICYLWSQHRCHHGNQCKFLHFGPGACIKESNSNIKKEGKQQQDEGNAMRGKKRGKCFAFKTKGRCSRGDNCPFVHDVEPASSLSLDNNYRNKKPKLAGDADRGEKSEKDCINWKTKGRCRKGDKCEYRHDPQVQERVLHKMKQKQKTSKKQKAQEKKQAKEEQNSHNNNNRQTDSR